MVAEIRDKISKLYSRDKLLDLLRTKECLISVHEHIDEEELFFTNGKSIFYGQNLSEFQASIPQPIQDMRGVSPAFFAAVFFSCPSYERFRAVPISQEVRGTTDIYFDINNRVFEEMGVLQHSFMNAAANPHLSSDRLPILPLPFLFVDPNQSASLFEKRYAPVIQNTMGLKWHPYAQNKEPKSYVNAGYLDLASDYRLPIVIHSERPGERGDLSALFRDVSPIAEHRKVNVDFAHMGFLHPDFTPLLDFEHSFVDIAPWSAICLGENQNMPVEGRVVKLAEYLSLYGSKMLFGLDTPYHWSLWSNGNIFGAEVQDELDIVSKAIRGMEPKYGRGLLYENPKMFLGA